MKKCVIYLRRSTDRQEQSVDDQRRAVTDYAEREGYDVIGEYVDDAISGALTEKRLDFLRMIEDAQAPGRPWDAILVYDVSRFGRQENDEAGYYRHLLSQAGVQIVYTAEGFSGDESDEILLPVKQYMASKYVRDLSKVTIRGLVSRAEKGRWPGGRPPYGYDLLHYNSADQPLHLVRYFADGTREIRTPDGSTMTRTIPMGEPLPVSGNSRAQLVPGEPGRVAVVGRVFSMYVGEGLGLGGIAKRLNSEGIPSPGRPRKAGASAGKWSTITVRDILKNPAYRGACCWNRRSFAKFNRVEDGRAVARPKHRRKKSDVNDEKDWIVVEHQHTPLIAKETWEAAQREMTLRAGTITPEQLRTARGNSRYILSGLVRCERCGARWQGYKVKKGRRKPGQKQPENFYYCCGSYIRQGNAGCERHLVKQQELEEIVLDLAQEHLSEFISAGGAALLTQFIGDEVSTSTSEETALRARVDADRKKLDELIECLTPALAPSLEPKIVALRAQVEDAEGRLRVIERMRVTQDEARAWVDELTRDATALGDLMRSGTTSERRAILRGITQEIAIDPATGTGTIAFYAIPKVSVESSGDEKRTSPGGDVLISRVAGGRLFAEQRTLEPGIWRKSFRIGRVSIAA